MNLSKVVALLLVLSFAMIGGCGGSDNTDLTVTVQPKEPLLIPNGQTYSCATALGNQVAATPSPPDMPGPFFTFNQMTISFNRAVKFYIATIRVKLRGSNLTSNPFQVDLAPQEIDDLFQVSNGLIDGSVTGATLPITKTVNTACVGVVFSGVPLVDANKASNFAGELQVLGYTIESDGTNRPYRTTVPFTVNYTFN